MILKKSFIITIDTEGDNLWEKPTIITTKNASFLPRFQELCEKYKYKPTYLTNYEMAKSRPFQELGFDILKRNVGEIGMHLHAWDMPPQFQLSNDDLRFHPYLIEYPEKIMREKIKLMTDTLEEIFLIKMLSHRAGRWSFNEIYARILIENGYRVDCSVTPHISWKKYFGDPSQSGGTDYTNFPSDAYFINLSDISIPGDSSLLEVPMSTRKLNYFFVDRCRNACNKVKLARNMINYIFPEIIWLRPNGRNLKYMLDIIDNNKNSSINYVEFMLHSSEFMPNGSPTFKSKESINILFDHIEILFNKAVNYFDGCTLTEYHKIYCENKNANKK